VTGALTSEQKEAQIAAVLAGQPLADTADADTELKKVNRELIAVREAKRVAENQLDDARKFAAKKICQSLKPDHDRLLKEACAGLIKGFVAYRELHAMKHALRGQGAGYHGLFDPEPDEIFGTPSDRSTEFSEFIRAAPRAGFCKEISQ
jgi:hypothetical protein